MLYRLHDLQRRFMEPFADQAEAVAKSLNDPRIQLGKLPQFRLLAANNALLARLARRYRKLPWGIDTVEAHGAEVSVAEEVKIDESFCQLRHFVRRSEDPARARRLQNDPVVLVCAPLSGHHATLLRDTVRTLLADHDVYVTDWVDARNVPLERGEFHLDDYVHTVMRFLRKLSEGGTAVHVVSVCQPTVPVLAAVSLMAQAGEPTPKTLTLMGGPIDARKNPTEVNTLATTHSFEWFEKNMIHEVPDGYPGRGRRVYPGFLQLTAFVMMNPKNHAKSYLRYWFDALKGESGEEGRATHERFYDEYNAVLDMNAAYYLDTVRVVFQEFALAAGTWKVRDVLVRPSAITDTAIFTVEGEKDDISGVAQTEAAHALCSGVPATKHKHYVALGAGHYGIFSGRKWRESVYPQVRDFIRENADAKAVASARAEN